MKAIRNRMGPSGYKRRSGGSKKGGKKGSKKGKKK